MAFHQLNALSIYPYQTNYKPTQIPSGPCRRIEVYIVASSQPSKITRWKKTLPFQSWRLFFQQKTKSCKASQLQLRRQGHGFKGGKVWEPGLPSITYRPWKLTYSLKNGRLDACISYWNTVVPFLEDTLVLRGVCPTRDLLNGETTKHILR